MFILFLCKFFQMLHYLHQLEIVFLENANPTRAKQQIQYMRNQFGGYGIPSPLRNELQKPFFDKNHLPSKETAFEMIKLLWEKPEREYQYFAMQLAFKYVKLQETSDIVLYEWLITHKSWWDTVDYVAPELVGAYFQKFPEMRDVTVEKWLCSGNIWLQRSCLIFQLKYRDKTDAAFLAQNINRLLGSKEFFINKAIGWSLRQYAIYHPQWVLNFVEKTPELSGLSRREAIRRIKV